MGRYPREARSAQVKCISCNAPVVRTVEEMFVCVACGRSPVERQDKDRPERAVAVQGRIATDGDPSASNND